MIVDDIKHEKERAKIRKNVCKSILNWGENNDYPQSVRDIVNGSYTGKACLGQYHKFVYGKGFADKDNYQIIVNDDGETADVLLDRVAEDYCMFGGFAIHLNFNLIGQVVSMRHIPLENVRICPDNGDHAGMVALHPDWGLRSYKRFSETPIEYIDLYTPSHDDFIARVQEAGGIEEYKGQIWYFSNIPGNYPLPLFDPALTDMATQEAISNITYRNSRRGFMSAGCFAEINARYDENNPDDVAAFEAVGNALRQMQGDKNAASIMHVAVNNREELPQFISLKGDNYDKEFTVSREAAQKSIGQCFMQPEELRCERTASGFANDSMIQAYNVYNSVTLKERYVLELEFTRLFKLWSAPLDYNFNILPLSYGSETILSRLGSDTTKAMVEMATNTELPVEQRKAILMSVYGLEESDANAILNIQTIA